MANIAQEPPRSIRIVGGVSEGVEVRSCSLNPWSDGSNNTQGGVVLTFKLAKSQERLAGSMTCVESKKSLWWPELCPVHRWRSLQRSPMPQLVVTGVHCPSSRAPPQPLAFQLTPTPFWVYVGTLPSRCWAKSPS